MSSVDYELLADYVGGALTGTPQNDYVAHLVETSPQWRAAAEEMTAALDLVSRDLATLRDQPMEMPADIAARFDELFAPPKKDPLAARPISGKAGRKRKWRRWAAPIAVAAAALTFFGLGQVPELATSQSGGAGSDSGERSNGEVAPQLDQPAAPAAAVPTIHSGTQYDRSNVGKRMTGDKGALTYGSTPDSTQLREGWQRFDQPQALSACLTAVAAVLPGQPTLVEFAYFDRVPALVISVTTFSGEWKFVAGTACGLGGPDEIYRTQLG